LSYKEFPYFKKQTLNAIQKVQLLHGNHLYWPELDIDLEIDNLENPEKYPLKSKITKKSSSRRSPFDVSGLRKKITRREILQAARESRHRAE
jgi:hypothetical protein